MIGNSLRWELNAFTGFIERQKNLYRRYWAWEAVWLLYNLVSVLSIGYLASGLSSLGLEPGPDQPPAGAAVLAGGGTAMDVSLDGVLRDRVRHHLGAVGRHDRVHVY